MPLCSTTVTVTHVSSGFTKLCLYPYKVARAGFPIASAVLAHKERQMKRATPAEKMFHQDNCPLTNLKLHETRLSDGVRKDGGGMHEPSLQRHVVDAKDNVPDEYASEFSWA